MCVRKVFGLFTRSEFTRNGSASSRKVGKASGFAVSFRSSSSQRSLCISRSASARSFDSRVFFPRILA